LSGGYDSTATAVLVREAGGHKAVTMLRRDDDGRLVDYPSAVAIKLGYELQEFERDTWRTRVDLPDAEIAAACTEFIDIPFLALEDELPGKLLFLGYPGDNLWSKGNFRCYQDIVQTDTCGLGLAEYRLRVGFAMCPTAYIGGTAHPSLFRISNSPEMSAWSVGGAYDRPIPRRIAEEAGIDRTEFATRKYAGSARIYSNTRRYVAGDPAAMRRDMGRFMTTAGAASFVEYCHENGVARRRVSMKTVTAGSSIYHKLLALNYRVGRRLYRYGIKGVVPRHLMAVLGPASSFMLTTHICYPTGATRFFVCGMRRQAA